MATEYGVIVKARPDVSEFDEELNSKLKGKKREIDINVAVSEEAVKKLNNIDERFQKIKQRVDTGFVLKLKTEQADGTFKTIEKEVYKVTQQFKDASGEIQTAISYIDSFGNIVSSKVVNSTKVFEGYNKTLDNTAAKLKTIAKETNIYKNSKGEQVTVETIKNNAGQEIKRTTYEMEELGKKTKVVTEQTRLANGQWEKAKEVLREVYNNEIALAEAQEKNQLANMKKNQEDYNKQMAEAKKHYEDNLKAEKEAMDANESLYNTQMREAEAIVKKNEELKKNTILYEENSKVKTKYNGKDAVLSIYDKQNAAGQTERTQILEFEDEFGRLVQKTNKYLIEQDGSIKNIGQSTKVIDDQVAKEKELEEQQKRTTAELQKRITSVNTYKGKEKEVYDLRDKTIHKLQSEVKETTNANNEMTRVTTTTDKFIDSQGMLNTKVTEATEKFKIVDGQLEKVGDTLEKTTVNVEKSKTGLNQLGQGFSDIIVKVAKFYLASLPIRAMQNAITSAIQTVKDFDSALTEFKKVSDLSGESLIKYTEQLEELGKQTARTRTEMVEMATQFRKSGFTDNDEVAQLANAAALYQNIADEELSASDASSVLISQIKAFQKEGLKAEQVIDAINETANRNAVSTSDIGRGLTQAGAALSTYGNTFYETIALVTAGTEIFQGRSQQVARGLNTVASRIAKNEKALQKYGVEIYDTNGDLKSTYDILSELAGATGNATKTWDEMTKAEQVALGTTLAGVNQYKVFSAVMTNFDTAVKVTTKDVENFNGSALRENERYMESIKAKLQAVKTELQELILKSNLQNLIKDVLQLADTFLKFQNSVGGLKPLLIALSGALLALNVDKIIVGFSKLKTLLSFETFKKVPSAFREIGKALQFLSNAEKITEASVSEGEIAIVAQTTATEGATVATETFKLSLESLQMVIALVTIAITATIMAINKYNSHQKELAKNAKEFIDEQQEEIKSLNEAIDKINKEYVSRDSLNDIIDKNISKYKEELNGIKDINDARERTLELLKEEQKSKAKELIAESGGEFKKYYKRYSQNEYDNHPDYASNLWDYEAENLAKAYANNVELQEQYGEGVEGALSYLEDVLSNAPDDSGYYYLFGSSEEKAEASQDFSARYDEKKLRETYNALKSESSEAKTFIDSFNDSLRSLGYTYEDVSGKGKNFELISLEDAMTRGSGSYGKGESVQQIYQEIADAKEQWKLTDEQAAEVKNHLSEYGYDVQKTVAGIFPDIVEKAQKAEDEINAFVDTFGLTADQVQAIRDKMAQTGSDDFFGTAVEVYPELEDGVNNYTEAMEEASEEEERSKELLAELGVKENALQKEIGMSSTELIRQADAWNVDEAALYNYLKALNQFDESLDNTQSAYGTLQTAIDEYNSMQGYSIDTMQALLRLSPEYLTMLDDELNGRKSLKDSITDKIKAQALEAKQEVYNMAIQRLQALSSEDSKNANDENASSFRNSVDDIDAQTEALNRNTATIMQNSAFKSAVGIGKKKEAEQVVKEMQEQLDIIDKAMLSLGTDFSTAMGKGTSSTKGANSALKEQNQLLKEQKQLLEEKKKQYDTVVSYIKKKIQDEIKKIEKEKKAQVDAIKEQIDALKDLKEEETNRIDEQIDKLKEQKEIEQTYWEEKIEAFKKQNEELEEQLEYEELLENLAKAKSKRVRVYKEGQGFVYTEDGNEVDKAQAEIDEYTRKKQYEDQLELLQSYKEKSEKNYEEQIKALEKLKDEKEKNYDEQIKALEKHQKEIEDAYDAQIAYFQGYLDKFTEQTDAYENETNRQLAIQLTGIDFEQQGWQKRLDNLSDFVQKYNALLGDIHTLDTGGNVESTDQQQQQQQKKQKNQQDNTAKTTQARQNVVNTIGGGSWSATADWYAKNYGGKKASGDSSISEDGMYLVGDSPNQELVIGSKLNGSLMSLSEGSGVVNATSTRTLAGVLNQLGLAGNQGINMSNSQNKSTNIQIGNISLPSVQNGKDFVDYLQNFSLQMTQEAFA